MTFGNCAGEREAEAGAVAIQRGIGHAGLAAAEAVENRLAISFSNTGTINTFTNYQGGGGSAAGPGADRLAGLSGCAPGSPALCAAAARAARPAELRPGCPSESLGAPTRSRSLAGWHSLAALAPQ